MVKEYYNLAKPGIVYGNALTTLAAFLFASGWRFSFGLFLATLGGLALVIASACVFNNYIDRDIDVKMERTKSRALARGDISGASALVYGAALGLAGFSLLFFYANGLTAAVALTGFVFYVFFYTFSKRLTPQAALIGSVSGAVPIVVGYTAVTGALDMAALVLFLILAIWQLPHFDAIALRRLDEYKAAGIPTLASRIGARATKLHIIVYIFLFILAVVTFWFLGYAGYTYLAVMLPASLAWLALALRGLKTRDNAKWARSVFLFSLVVLLVFSLMLALAPLVP